MEENMKLIDPKDNLIANEWQKRYSLLNQDTKEKIDKFFTSMKPEEYQLKVIKRTRTKPAEGDIFILSPRENLFFYGRVLISNINHIAQSPFIHGKSVIVIFRCRSEAIGWDGYRPNYDELLIQPTIVDSSYWSRGFFHTIGNKPISKYESKLDIGFYDTSFGIFRTETGKEMNHRPKLLGMYGISTIIGITIKVNQELIIQPKLLDIES